MILPYFRSIIILPTTLRAEKCPFGVHVEDVIPILLGHFQRRLGETKSRAVDEN